MEERKIFDSKFVHFMWDKSLEGKEGFVASTIKWIINCVENDVRINHWQKLEESRSTDLPFHSITGMDYGFAYYDPLYEVKWAWKQGKQIQVRSKGSTRNEWMNMDPIGWFDTYEYRVKPVVVELEEQEEPKKKRRMTNRELAKWIAEGNGLARFMPTGITGIDYTYRSNEEDASVSDTWKICGWDEKEWHVPEVEG